MQFYAETNTLGSRREWTPEGFLICRDVPIARTGQQIYAPGEVPIEPGKYGLIVISRDPSEVFSENTINSFNGKPVTDDHPPEKVIPENWKKYAGGIVVNPRRGQGQGFDPDFMYADLVIHDKDFIQKILDGKVEVSAGYDAEYTQLAPGLGKQTNILGNHVALVEKGRCGPACAIGDSAMPRNLVRDKIMSILKGGRTTDEQVQELEKIVDLMGSANDEEVVPATNPHHVTVNLHGSSRDDEPGNTQLAELMARVDALEAAVAALAEGEYEERGEEMTESGDRRRARDASKEEWERERSDKTGDESITPNGPIESQSEWSAEGGTSPDRLEASMPNENAPAPPAAGTGDRTRKRTGDAITADSRGLAQEFQDAMSRAEILLPGIRLMTFDAAKPASYTSDMLCRFRNSTMEQAANYDPTIRQIIEGANGGKLPQFGKLTCDASRMLFNAASEIARMQNNGRAMHVTAPRIASTAGKVVTPADINKRNREAYRIAR